MILYVDAVYLLFDALAWIPLSYVYNTLLMPQDSLRELDIFGTELEKCIGKESFGYWLIRGDLQFFLYNDKWQPANWVGLLVDNRPYATVVPFVFIFARMLAKKFNANFVIVAVATIAAFVTAKGTYDWTEGKARDAFAAKSNCGQTYVKTILSTYSTERIARQLEFKLTNELQRYFSNPDLVVRMQGNDYVFSINLRRAANMMSDEEMKDALSRFIRTAYCSDRPYFIAVRGIKYNIAASAFSEGVPFYSEHFRPEGCPRRRF
jgi:hypothetical protein